MFGFAKSVGVVILAGSVLTLHARAVWIVATDDGEARRQSLQVEADRRVRNERDAAVQDRDAAHRAKLAAECELLGAKLMLDEWRRRGVLLPAPGGEVRANELIPAPVVPFPTRAEK
jgi:hypothetical protein